MMKIIHSEGMKERDHFQVKTTMVICVLNSSREGLGPVNTRARGLRIEILRNISNYMRASNHAYIHLFFFLERMHAYINAYTLHTTRLGLVKPRCYLPLVGQ